MANLGTLTLDIIAKIGGFTGPLSQAERQAKKSSSSMGDSFKSMSKVAVAAFASAATALSYYVTKSNHAADESVKAAQKAGMSVEAFTGLAFVADLAGINMESFTGAMVKLNKALGEASVGSAEQLASFKALGISVKDSEGNILSADKVLVSLSDKFAKMPDGVEKTAMAIKIFGKAGAEMIPLLNGGGESIKELIQLAQDLGVVIGEEQAKKAEQFNDSVTILSYAAKGAANRVAGSLLPVMNDIVGIVIDYSKEANNAASKTDGLQNAFRFAAAFAIQASTAIANVYRSLYALAKMGTVIVEGGFSGNALSEASKIYREITAENIQATKDAKTMADNVRSGKSAKSGQEAIKAMGQMTGVLQDQKNLAKELTDAENKKKDLEIAKAKAKEESIKKEYEWQKKLIDLKVSAGEVTDIEGQREKEKINNLILEAERQSLEIQIKNSKEEKDRVKATSEYWETYSKGSQQAIEAQYAMNDLLDARNEREIAVTEQISKQKTAFGGMKAALSDYYDTAMNTGAAIEAATVKAFRGMEDAIMNFVQTGKLSFSDLANSIISDMIRIVIQQQITAPLANAFSSGISSVFGTTPTTAPRALGGQVAGNQTYLIGERGPELLTMGNQGGYITPSTSMLGGATSAPIVEINIQNNTGQQMSASVGNTQQDGKKFVINAVIENISNNGVLRSVLGAR